MSLDKKWVVTADSGLDSILVVWDSITGVPIKTFFNPHPDGILNVDISPDSLYLVTLSGVGCGSQKIALWEWTSPNPDPIMTCDVKIVVMYRFLQRIPNSMLDSMQMISDK